MGRRRRRVIRIVKKKLPTVFVCPRCGEEAVRVTIAKDTGRATVMCAMCQLKDEFQAHPAAQMIDVYSYFADRFYGVKDPRPIIPREREISHLAPDEETEEPAVTEATIEPPDEPSITKEEPLVEPQPEPQATEAKESSEIPEPTVGAEKVPTEKPSETTLSTEPAETAGEKEGPQEDENEPFADILGPKDEDKEKKRYSATPLPQQQSEQAS